MFKTANVNLIKHFWISASSLVIFSIIKFWIFQSGPKQANDILYENYTKFHKNLNYLWALHYGNVNDLQPQNSPKCGANWMCGIDYMEILHKFMQCELINLWHMWYQKVVMALYWYVRRIQKASKKLKVLLPTYA